MRKTEPRQAAQPRHEPVRAKPLNARPAADKRPADKPLTAERCFGGLPVGAGIAIGPDYLIEDKPPAPDHGAIPADAVETELARLDEAVAKSRRQLGKLRAQLAILPAEGQ